MSSKKGMMPSLIRLLFSVFSADLNSCWSLFFFVYTFIVHVLNSEVFNFIQYHISWIIEWDYFFLLWQFCRKSIILGHCLTTISSIIWIANITTKASLFIVTRWHCTKIPIWPTIYLNLYFNYELALNFLILLLIYCLFFSSSISFELLIWDYEDLIRYLILEFYLLIVFYLWILLWEAVKSIDLFTFID